MVVKGWMDFILYQTRRLHRDILEPTTTTPPRLACPVPLPAGGLTQNGRSSVMTHDVMIQTDPWDAWITPVFLYIYSI